MTGDFDNNKMSSRLRSDSLRVLIDTSNKCNLRCRMCHFSFEKLYGQKPVYMQPETFRKIVEPIKERIGTLTLSAASEPLTSPFFLEILRIASGYEIPESKFLTNGTLLNCKAADAVIDSGLSELMISVDGATKKTYEYIRRGADFGKLLKNIEYLANRKAVAGKGPIIQFNVTLMKSNITELEDLVIMAANLGVSRMAIRHLILFEGLGLECESLSGSKELSNYWLNRALQRAALSGVAITSCPDDFIIETEKAICIPAKDRDKNSFLNNAKELAGLFHTKVRSRFVKPFGYIDTPEKECQCNSDTVVISGWALGRSEIRRIEIVRDPLPGESKPAFLRDPFICVGTARLVNGSRPDIAALYPEYPFSNRSGWLYSLSRSALPSESRTFRIYAVAYDAKGSRAFLGCNTIEFVDGMQEPNLYCSRPFNSLYIDSSGDVYPYPDCQPVQRFGSFLRDSFDEIWFGASFTELRERIIRKDPPEICKKCPDFISRNVDNCIFFQAKSVEHKFAFGFIDVPRDNEIFESEELEIRGRIKTSTGIEKIEVKGLFTLPGTNSAAAEEKDLIHLGFAQITGNENWSFVLKRSSLPDKTIESEFKIYVFGYDSSGGRMHMGIRRLICSKTTAVYT